MAEPDRKCETCKWWLEIEDPLQHSGQCRALPPVATLSGGWSYTKPDDWCGQYEEKK